MQVGVERVLDKTWRERDTGKSRGCPRKLVIVPYKITRAGHLLWGMSPQQVSVLS